MAIWAPRRRFRRSRGGAALPSPSCSSLPLATTPFPDLEDHHDPPVREKRRSSDPSTPDIHLKISTKRFNGLVRSWRRKLHLFDPVEGEANDRTTTPGASTGFKTDCDSGSVSSQAKK